MKKPALCLRARIQKNISFKIFIASVVSVSPHLSAGVMAAPPATPSAFVLDEASETAVASGPQSELRSSFLR